MPKMAEGTTVIGRIELIYFSFPVSFVALSLLLEGETVLVADVSARVACPVVVAFVVR